MSELYCVEPQEAYTLLDTGNGMKLERFGDVTLARPDPEALWLPHEKDSIWKKADATFVRRGASGKWDKLNSCPTSWTMPFGGLTFEIRPTSFKHVGLFPEQLAQWTWMQQKIKKEISLRNDTSKPITVLNLFGYTGGATLACAHVGAEVCHLDGSKTAIAWARTNAELSGLSEKPVRWILDDAIAFMRREIKRGRRYDAIIMDPPAFGHGPNGELWKIEEHFYLLMELTEKLLSDTPLFVIINGYASGYSSIAYENNLTPLIVKYGGSVTRGELAIREQGGQRLLPCGIFARWEK